MEIEYEDGMLTFFFDVGFVFLLLILEPSGRKFQMVQYTIYISTRLYCVTFLGK